ncbi:hypothetical protein NOF04DRAFT_18145 [Fusarium oxysporum II5]|uniref:Uncharacterized protein n=1 Tax=Fusarium odoratissimum (strain NRRL 54006) TaxID=1089451 RepID=X0J4C0_FUSO5|nr:uncharacterized protein FOIG_15638 [Fusarium odoratissimum NRRL 54006]EXL91140.1 hypothetical protein FOIG_15638 [Fusarium odoratissimum NRRL 54006]KAK2129020.1 hypothetical protein NOF04DRAFT_18145 [Fusarium oxysporum II5]
MEKAYFDAITSEGKYKTSIEALNNLLPAYKDTQFAYDSDTPEASRQEICNFLQGPDSEQPNTSKHYLVHKYGTSLGEAWAALAAVTAYKQHLGTGGNAASSGSDQGTSRPKRVRRSTVHANYGPFGEQIFGSSPANKTSSPDNPPSSLEQRAANLTRPESHSLLHTALLVETLVDFRDKRQRMSLETTGLNGQIIAIDDGGLTLKPDEDNGAFPDPDVTVALVEAKRCLKVDGGSPMISDECLAQMVYAAVMARDRDRTVQPVNASITITNTTQHYICFFQFDMKDDYLDDLKEGDVPTQQLTATVTEWFDLSQKKRRTAVLKNVYSLIDLAKEKPVFDFGEDRVRPRIFIVCVISGITAGAVHTVQPIGYLFSFTLDMVFSRPFSRHTKHQKTKT